MEEKTKKLIKRSKFKSKKKELIPKLIYTSKLKIKMIVLVRSKMSSRLLSENSSKIIKLRKQTSVL
jgi:hypothetical protein